MRYYVLLLVSLVVMMSPSANAQSFEFPVGGGSSRCLVRYEDPEGLTVVPVGAIEDGDYQMYHALLTTMGVSLGVGLLCIVFLIVCGLFWLSILLYLRPRRLLRPIDSR